MCEVAENSWYIFSDCFPTNILRKLFELFCTEMMSIILYPSLILLLWTFEVTSELEYKFVNVIFRHGDRTPTNKPREAFPTSPYARSNFYPHGHGQLTNKGKQRVYELGIYIREQYGQFLGNIYYPKVVFARSTYYDRTKMSLQLVMAGIFPPALEQKWNLELNWQPVVVNYVPPGNDSLMLFYRFSKFKEEYDTVKRLPGVRKEIEKFSDFGKNLSEWTGASITDIEHFNFIYHSLASLHSMELDLPTWTSGIFPHGALLNATVLDYRLLNYNRKLRCLSGGVILKKFIDNMLAVAKKDGDSEFKMELLGGHDLNIVSMLKILDVYQAHVPEYSSAIFVELLADNDRYFVNIHYYLGMPPIRTSIEIPGCGELWPLGTFVKLFNDSLPTAENIC